jgi:hypothetical protein
MTIRSTSSSEISPWSLPPSFTAKGGAPDGEDHVVTRRIIILGGKHGLQAVPVNPWIAQDVMEV